MRNQVPSLDTEDLSITSFYQKDEVDSLVQVQEGSTPRWAAFSAETNSQEIEAVQYTLANCDAGTGKWNGVRLVSRRYAERRQKRSMQR